MGICVRFLMPPYFFRASVATQSSSPFRGKCEFRPKLDSDGTPNSHRFISQIHHTLTIHPRDAIQHTACGSEKELGEVLPHVQAAKRYVGPVRLFKVSLVCVLFFALCCGRLHLCAEQTKSESPKVHETEEYACTRTHTHTRAGASLSAGL